MYRCLPTNCQPRTLSPFPRSWPFSLNWSFFVWMVQQPPSLTVSWEGGVVLSFLWSPLCHVKLLTPNKIVCLFSCWPIVSLFRKLSHWTYVGRGQFFLPYRHQASWFQGPGGPGWRASGKKNHSWAGELPRPLAQARGKLDRGRGGIPGRGRIGAPIKLEEFWARVRTPPLGRSLHLVLTEFMPELISGGITSE